MNGDALEEEIITFVATRLGIARDRVRRTSDFIDDFGADSLTLIEMKVDFEEKFDVVFADTPEGKRARTVGDVVDFVRAQQARRGHAHSR